jgi:hypothetical protein
VAVANGTTRHDDCAVEHHWGCDVPHKGRSGTVAACIEGLTQANWNASTNGEKNSFGLRERYTYNRKT